MSFEEGSPVPGAAGTGSVSERSAQGGAIATPRTPRQLLGWTVPDHIAVTEGEGNHYLRCEHGHVGTSMTVSQFMGTDRFVRGFLQDHAHGETVELLSEVLPETPEPPRPECECFTTPEEQWTRYGDATEPGSMVEPNPDCQVHFPASQSDPAVPVSSTGGKETGEDSSDAQSETQRAALVSLVHDALCRCVDAPSGLTIREHDGYLAADAILAAGWRPPLPEGDSACWQITVQVPAAVPVEQRQELFSRIAEVAHDWEPDDRDGWDVDVSGHPGEYLWVENQRLRTLIGDLGRKIAASSPLPDSETEPDAMQWGYREHPAEDVDPVREEYARFRAQDEHLKLVQREIRFGPWIEVTS